MHVNNNAFSFKFSPLEMTGKISENIPLSSFPLQNSTVIILVVYYLAHALQIT